MTWKPNIVTRQAIQGFISDLFSTAPEIMGIDEAISACEVILMDPYTTGALPRYIRVRIREYYQDVMWRGSPSLVVGDFCTVLHFRDGNRYEVVGASGATGIDVVILYLYVWVYDVSEGLLIPYDTINGALGYGPLAAGDFVLIPPGTFDETITLVSGVFICEQIPGTVTITYTGAPNANSGTVVVVDDGYLNVRNVYRAVDGDCNAVYAGVIFEKECIIIVENIEADGAPDGNFIRGVRMDDASGTLHLYAKNITALSPDPGGWTGYAVQCWYGNGTLNLYAEQGYGTGPTTGYGISCGGNLADGGFTINVYGGVWEGAGPNGSGIYCTSYGVVTVLHAKAVGSTQDIYITGTGIIYIFQVQYDTVTGTLTHLPGDHIVLDLDGDTYVSALLADDRIDFYVAGANPTNIRVLANNVVSLVDNLAQAFSIADVGAFGYMHIATTNAQPIVTFNIGEEDIDFRVCASGITDAIFVDGATGAITVEGPSLTVVPAAWNLIVPDNIADAFGLDDAGGLEYLRINSQNANPYFLIDPAGAGVLVGIACTPTVQLTIQNTGLTADSRILLNTAINAAARGGYQIYRGNPPIEVAGYAVAGGANDYALGSVAGDLVVFSWDVASNLKMMFATGAAPTARMTILGDGKVGVGIVAPLALLDVYHTPSTADQAPANAGVAPVNAIARFGGDRGAVVDIGYQQANPWGIWLQGTDSGDLSVEYPLFLNPNGGNVGINLITAPIGVLHIDQPTNDAAIPVLILDQADISEGFIDFYGSNRGVITGATNSVLSVRVEYGGVVYRLALYVDA